MATVAVAVVARSSVQQGLSSVSASAQRHFVFMHSGATNWTKEFKLRYSNIMGSFEGVI